MFPKIWEGATLDAAGSVTKPTETISISLETPYVFDTHYKYGAMSTCPIPGIRGVMLADGVNFVQNFVWPRPYNNSLLAPVSAPTATPTGTQATTVLDIDNGGAYVVANGDFFHIIKNLNEFALTNKITFRTNRSWAGDTNEVFFDGTTAGAMTQLRKFINQTGVEGDDYYTVYDFSAELSAAAPTTSPNDTITITATTYGTIGNGYVCVWGGGAGPRFETAGNVAQTVFSGGVAGGSGPSAGTYQYGYTYIRKADGAESGMSPIVEVNNGGGGSVSLASILVSPDSTVDLIRIYRTLSGGGILYRVDEIANSGAGSPPTTSFTDSVSNAAISGFDAIPFDATLYRTYSEGYGPRVRYLALYQGQWFGAGARLFADYTSGAVSYTQGSKTVNFYTPAGPAYVNPTWIGRSFQSDATTEDIYYIVAVDQAANSFTLNRNYEGASGVNSTYVIRDRRDPYELHWTEPGMPSSWISSLTGPNSPDNKGCSGLFAAFGSLIYFTRQNMWQVQGSGGEFQVVKISEKAGCVGSETIVMDGSVMYWLGQDGVYAWSGSGEPVNMTTPPKQDVAIRGQDETIARLNLSHAHNSVAVFDQKRQEARWYVPLDGSRYNNFVFVLDTKNGTFSLDTCSDVTFTTTIHGSDGEDRVITGDITGAMYEQGLSTADGGYGIEPVRTITASTRFSVTVSGTPFSTTDNGYWGCPVWHCDDVGQFVPFCVESNTSSTLTFRRAMADAPPYPTTQFVLGGILMWVQTGRFDFGDRFREKIVPAYIISHEPQSDGQYFFMFAYDQDPFRRPTIGWTAGDLTVGNTVGDFGPRRRFRARKQSVLHGWGIVCVEPGCSPRFTSVAIEVRGPSNLEL
jgi:hypothetical protein